MHDDDAFARLHARPHPPQWELLVPTSVSQPFIELPSQFAKPGLHMPSWHAPMLHVADAFVNVHTRPQLPQLFVLVIVLMHDIPQRVSPVPHPSTQRIAVVLQIGVAPEHTSAHRLHADVVPSIVSQPLAGLLSQSAKPVLHVIPQVPMLHVGTLLATLGHAFPQRPQ